MKQHGPWTVHLADAACHAMKSDRPAVNSWVSLAMETAHEPDYRPYVTDAGAANFLPGSSVEIIRDARQDEPPRFALFDFDGTLSLIREGWIEVMVSMMVEILRETRTNETDEALYSLALSFVTELNGKQTIYQMFRLAEEVEQRGGTPEDPLSYKHRYHDRLMKHIHGRLEALRRGAIPPGEMLVPFALDMLDELVDRDVELYLASGTDEQYVREEAELLGLDAYFGQHISGAVDDYKTFSKALVIQRILDENDIDASRLVGFGDGYVEIDNIKSAGGIAIGVASDEAGRSGKPNPWKRERLIGIGADVVIPDFHDGNLLCRYLWREA